jgi:hypothetical protein
MLSLHRAWCEFATRQYASDPLSSRYGVSVIACYRSASAMLAVACEAYDVMPHPTIRLSCIFYQAFTAAVSVEKTAPLWEPLMGFIGHPCLHRDTLPFASFRTRCLAACKPSKGLPHTVSHLLCLQLDRIDGLAQRWLKPVQPATLLATLSELRDSARASYDGHLTGESTDLLAPASARVQDILDCVSGRTRCVARPHEDTIPQNDIQTVFDPLHLPPEASNIFGTLEELSGVHPSVLEYLQTLV